MSQRGEKRLRQMERRMGYIGEKTDVLALRQDRTDIRFFKMSRIQTEIRLLETKVEGIARIPAQARPQKGLLWRIVDFLQLLYYYFFKSPVAPAVR